jgi:hypothetical protein
MVLEHVHPRFLDKGRTGGTRICIECNMASAPDAANDYAGLTVSSNKEPYQAFLASMYEVEALLIVRIPDDRLQQSMRRILFSSVITSMETYLADTFINRVLQDPMLLRRCVETNPDLRQRKLDLGTLFDRHDKIATEVRDYLSEVLFHNLAKIGNMYKAVLDVAFPTDMAELFRAVQIRHDIVHRSGKSKDGSQQAISETELRALVATMKSFVGHVEQQLSDRGVAGLC